MTDTPQVAVFHYRLRTDADGEIDSSHARGPNAVLLGQGQLLESVEAALGDMATDETRTLTIPPEQAYGVRDPARVRRMPRKRFANVGPLRPGMRLAAEGDDGVQTVTVVKVGATVVDIDTNHPMAGATLHFELLLLERRDALPDELAHGHAHGPGGHRH